MIVAVAVFTVPRLAPDAEVNVTVNVSSPSLTPSPTNTTSKDAALAPLRIFTTPDGATKSVPADAGPDPEPATP